MSFRRCVFPDPNVAGDVEEARFLVWVLVDEVPERGEHVAGAVGLVELSDVVFGPRSGVDLLDFLEFAGR